MLKNEHDSWKQIVEERYQQSTLKDFKFPMNNQDRSSFVSNTNNNQTYEDEAQDNVFDISSPSKRPKHNRV